MPDQPADPIHYDMKIPPEPQDAPLNADEERDKKHKSPEAGQRGSDDVTGESNKIERDGGAPGVSGNRK